MNVRGGCSPHVHFHLSWSGLAEDSYQGCHAVGCISTCRNEGILALLPKRRRRLDLGFGGDTSRRYYQCSDLGPALEPARGH